jgi:AcrR family transcriptional regulator
MKDKKSLLIEATIDLYSKEGFWNTTTAKIAKHAKVGTGTLFNYFPTKEALTDAVYLELKREMKNYILLDYSETQDTVLNIKHVWQRYSGWAMENPVRYSLLEQLWLSNQVSQEVEDRLLEELKFMHKLLEDASAEGLFGSLPLDYVSAIMCSSMQAMIKYALAHKLGCEVLEQHISTGFSILWNGISSMSQEGK